MKKLTVTGLLVLMLCEGNFSQQHCLCKKAKQWQTSSWGHIANEYREEEPVKKLYGRVLDPTGTLLDETLVEAFTDEGKNGTPTSPKQKRVAACWTDNSGLFCFDKLRPGKYIVAASRQDFNITFVQVTLAPKYSKSSSKPLNVELKPGT